MKKFLFSIAALMLFCGVAFADATATSTVNSRTATYNNANTIVGVVDVANGYTQRVDSRGAASTTLYPSVITSSTGATLTAGTALYTDRKSVV